MCYGHLRHFCSSVSLQTLNALVWPAACVSHTLAHVSAHGIRLHPLSECACLTCCFFAIPAPLVCHYVLDCAFCIGALPSLVSLACLLGPTCVEFAAPRLPRCSTHWAPCRHLRSEALLHTVHTIRIIVKSSISGGRGR